MQMQNLERALTINLGRWPYVHAGAPRAGLTLNEHSHASSCSALRLKFMSNRKLQIFGFIHPSLKYSAPQGCTHVRASGL